MSLNSGYGDPPKSTSLFDGKTLNGWAGDEEIWRVEDGAITAEILEGERLRGNRFLFWEGEVHDFELSLEFRISGGPSANSGIQYRAQRDEHDHAQGYQADLDAGGAWLGRIYDEEEERKLLVERGTHVSIAPDGRRWVDEFRDPKSFKSVFRPDAWNSYRITALASHVEIWINGELFSSLDDHQVGEAELSGLLAFQLHSGKGPAKVQFRNIQLADRGRTKPSPPVVERESSSADFATIAPLAKDGHELNLGFESGNLDDWTAEGNAWDHQPKQMRDSNTRTRRADGKAEPDGRFWIGPSRESRDIGTGRLTSQAFTVTENWASYLIAGGGDINQTRFELVLAETGAIIHSASGENSELARREVIDLSSIVGKEVFLRLVDDSNEEWGHISFDDFVFHDRKPDFSQSADSRSTRQNESPVLWHLQPNPAPPSPVANVDAQTVVRDMKLTPGFEAELIAAEPDIHQPIAFTLDDRGRIWVVEAYSYPSKKPEGEGLDRIVIFEDQDADGHFETRKVFAEKLNLVSGIELGFGGVFVGAAPELLFIPDRNQDDIPDGPGEVLLDGWGYQDTHETLNSFAWGPDGWLYGLQGVFTISHVGKPGTPDDERQELRAGVWRYHPTRHVFEIYAHGGSNQWGIDFNENGHAFITHCRSFRGGGGTSYMIRNGHYWLQSNKNYASFISNRAPDFAPGLLNYLLASARYDSGEGGAGKPGSANVYGGHSHVGIMIYLGDNWPDAYRDHLFTHNLHGHQVNHQHNVREGSGYQTYHAGYDIMFTPDNTFMGVDLKYGPDGGVYMIDWCDHQHCHSRRDDVWERNNGRLYRVTWGETWKPISVSLRDLSDLELAELHTHRNEWHVRTARRLLQERAVKGTIDPSGTNVLKKQAQEAEMVSDQLRAYWTLHAIDALSDERLDTMLQHSSDVVRSWGIALGTENPDQLRLSSKTLRSLAKNDPSPMVRLALASAMPAIETDDAWFIAGTLSQREEDAEDRYLPKMIWYGIAQLLQADQLDRALKIAQGTPMQSLADSIHWYASKTDFGRDRWVAQMATEDEAAARDARLLAFCLEAEKAMPMPKSWPRVAQNLSGLPETSPGYAAVRELSALFGDESVLEDARTQLSDTSASLEKRKAALALLERSNDPQNAPVYRELLDETQFRPVAIEQLAKLGDPSAAQALLEDFDSLDPEERADALDILTRRPSYAKTLLNAVSENQFSQSNLNALHFRQLRNLNNDTVDALMDRIWTNRGESSANVRETIARLRKVYNETPKWTLNKAAGRTVYQQLCVSCHAIDGEGGQLGPDLSGAWRNGVDYYLENIVDPNSVIGTDYQLNLITLKDGSVVSGMIDRETDATLVIRTITDTVNVSKDQIANRVLMEQSMMPPGLLESQSESRAVELLHFLLSER